MGGGLKVTVIAGALALAFSGTAWADACPGNPDAIGTSRVMVVNPIELPRIGALNHGRNLPLAPGEVVLTFDDGPRTPFTQSVLQTLAKNCVKATFFMIGRNAKAEPQVARMVLSAGHTIGTHTENHPLRTMAPARAFQEINTGIITVGRALGDPNVIAPYFRFPGLHHTAAAEQYLRNRSISAWSVDVDSHDWKRITPEHIVHNVMTRLAARGGRGVILLHDVHGRTAEMLPALLAELKQSGYRIVHAVAPAMPAEADRVAMTLPAPIEIAKPAPAAPTAVALKLRPTIHAPRPPIRVASAKARPHGKATPSPKARPQAKTAPSSAKTAAAIPHRRAIYR